MHHLYVKYENLTSVNQSRYDYFSCIDPEFYGNFINREIGDEVLFLNNYSVPWDADFDAEYWIYTNVGNPDFQNGTGAGGWVYGAYAKTDIFDITDSSNVDFYADSLYYGLPAPSNGTYSQQFTRIINCCQVKSQQISEQPELENSATLYPNPLGSDLLNIRLTLSELSTEPMVIRIFNDMGQLMGITPVQTFEGNEVYLTLDVSRYNLAPGIYIFEIGNSKVRFTKRIVKL
jgi:hypothetical protein